MDRQMKLIEYLIPEFYYCDYHESWAPRCFYTDEEIIEMLEEQGFVDCPMCLAEVAGCYNSQ